MEYPVIAIVCYILITFVRKTAVKNEWLPLISCGVGAGLAVLGFFALPDIITASAWHTAMIGGALSGLAATGGNQVFKQAVKLICEKRGIDYDKVEPITDEVDKALNPEDANVEEQRKIGF